MPWNKYSLFFVVSSMLSGCVSVPSYAKVYFTKSMQDKEVAAPQSLMERQNTVRAFRQKSIGEERTDELERCELFRNQLFAASLHARGHLNAVYWIPFLWPVHLLSAFQYPLHEARVGGEVQSAAARIEQAYQADENAFLQTCRSEMETETGKVFVQQSSAWWPRVKMHLNKKKNAQRP